MKIKCLKSKLAIFVALTQLVSMSCFGQYYADIERGAQIVFLRKEIETLKSSQKFHEAKLMIIFKISEGKDYFFDYSKPLAALGGLSASALTGRILHKEAIELYQSRFRRSGIEAQKIPLQRTIKGALGWGVAGAVVSYGLGHVIQYFIRDVRLQDYYNKVERMQAEERRDEMMIIARILQTFEKNLQSKTAELNSLEKQYQRPDKDQSSSR